jgi:hypothetical protein
VVHSVLKGTISFRVTPTNLEAIAWMLYAIPVSIIYALGYRTAAKSKA